MSDVVDVINTEIKMKDCPLCGGEVELRYSGRVGRIVRCKKCLFGLKQKVLRNEVEWLERKMIEKWNKRVEQINSKYLADLIYQWLSKQKYGDQEILHSAVCCDFVGKVRFKKAIAKVIDEYKKQITPDHNDMFTSDSQGHPGNYIGEKL